MVSADDTGLSKAGDVGDGGPDGVGISVSEDLGLHWAWV